MATPADVPEDRAMLLAHPSPGTIGQWRQVP